MALLFATDVGMTHLAESSVGLLDFRFCSIVINTQDLVVVDDAVTKDLQVDIVRGRNRVVGS